MSLRYPSRSTATYYLIVYAIVSYCFRHSDSFACSWFSMSTNKTSMITKRAMTTLLYQMGVDRSGCTEKQK